MQRRHFLQGTVAAAVAAGLSPSLYASAIAALTEVQGDVRAVTGAGAEISVEGTALKELSESLRGKLLMPGNAGYEKARRVLNPVIDKHPAFVVQPSGTADIMSAVSFARERDMLVAVKCGGHSWPGKSTCDGGMQIDLSTYRAAKVNPDKKYAAIAGGSLLGELDHEAMAHGLVTTAGTVSHTGVGGLTLGGGFGRLARRFGLALDNVKAVDIVTADGKLRYASPDENPDLYWAVRGGGGNFGVVTTFYFGLHEMQPDVVRGDFIFPLASMKDVLNMYFDYLPRAPRELYLDFVASSELGSTEGMSMIHAVWSGDPGKADAVFAPIAKAGKTLQQNVGSVPYVKVQSEWDNTDPRNTGQYLKSGFVNDMPGKLASELVANFDTFEERGTTLFFQCSGGAIGDVPADATAFAHRKSIANMFTVVDWPKEQDAAPHIAYARDNWKPLAPYTDGWYTNEAAGETPEQFHANYQGNFARLQKVKNQYDPTNLFRLNANITPSV
jgi:FAD/FMN-containing dehydrogenase